MRHFLLLFLALCATSCSTMQQYYQVVQVHHDNLSQEDQMLVYKDSNCHVAYDLWAEGGNPGFVFYNASDSMIYLDLSKSFFVINGKTNDYFGNRSFSSNLSATNTVSFSKGASAYGVHNSRTPIKVDGTIATTAAALSSQGITVHEKSIIAIPPHAYKTIQEFIIEKIAFVDCDLKQNVSKGQPSIFIFEQNNSPLSFLNYISYVIGGENHVVENKFYVSEIKNVCQYDFKEVVVSEDCITKRTKMIYVDLEQAPDKFYVRYTPAEIEPKKRLFE